MNNFDLEVSIDVQRGLQSTFRLFTEEIDRWWLRGPKHRFRAPWRDGTLSLECALGGRLTERYPDGDAFVIGEVIRWEPPAHLSLTWRLPNFASDEATRVDVRFEPVGDATRVTVQHGGWHALRADHPARHRLAGRELVFMKASLWGETLESLARFCVRSVDETRKQES